MNWTFPWAHWSSLIESSAQGENLAVLEATWQLGGSPARGKHQTGSDWYLTSPPHRVLRANKFRNKETSTKPNESRDCVTLLNTATINWRQFYRKLRFLNGGIFSPLSFWLELPDHYGAALKGLTILHSGLRAHFSQSNPVELAQVTDTGAAFHKLGVTYKTLRKVI